MEERYQSGRDLRDPAAPLPRLQVRCDEMSLGPREGGGRVRGAGRACCCFCHRRGLAYYTIVGEAC